MLCLPHTPTGLVGGPSQLSGDDLILASGEITLNHHGRNGDPALMRSATNRSQ